MALKDKVLRRTFAILELPLAVVDTTLDHKIGVVGSARDFLAAQVRRLDRKMGVGPEAEEVTHFEAEAPKAEAKPPKAEAPKAEAPKAEAPKAEAKAPKAEAPKAEAKAPKAKAPKAKASDILKESGTSTLPKVPKKTGTHAAKAPFADYDKLNVHKVSRHVRNANLDLLASVEAYEIANKNRKTILNAIESRRERLAND